MLPVSEANLMHYPVLLLTDKVTIKVSNPENKVKTGVFVRPEMISGVLELNSVQPVTLM